MVQKKKKITDLVVGRGENFSVSFATYFTNDGKFKETREALNQRRFTVGGTDISYRVINHWHATGILPKGVSDDGVGWRKFTFIELVWLKAVSKFREFGFSLEKIAKVRDQIMQWENETENYPLFEFYIAEAWTTKLDPYIVCFPDGNAELLTSAEIERAKIIIGSKDMLLVSLKSLLKEQKMTVVPATILFNISPEELELLQAVRFNENKEVKAKIKNGNVNELEITKMYPEAPPLEDINRVLKQEGTFAEVVTKYEGGKKQSAEVKTKKRWK